MGSIRDEETPINLDAPRLESSDLVEESWEMHHDAIANYAYGLWIEDA